MHEVHKQRIAWALKCKPEDVPKSDKDIKAALELRRKDLKEAKLRKVSNG
jgi:hypothetical protein